MACGFYNDQKHLNRRCELEDMVIWVAMSGSCDSQGMNMYNFVNTCQIGASEESIGIYVKRRWQ
jgi:hypothetical protein